MRPPDRIHWIAALVLLTGTVAPMSAQQPAQPAGAVGEPRLVFEREVFAYPASARRDPFKALSASEGSGPLFEELTVRMIIFAPTASQSIVLLGAGPRVHRLRRGDSVGNVTVVDIAPTRVLVSVEEFGMRRQEVLDLRPNKLEGATR